MSILRDDDPAELVGGVTIALVAVIALVLWLTSGEGVSRHGTQEGRGQEVLRTVP